MEAKKFYQILEESNALNAEQIKEINALIEEYPFFSCAYSIKIRDLINKKSPNAFDEFSSYSVFLQNRSDIYDDLISLNIQKQNSIDEEEDAYKNTEFLNDSLTGRDFTLEIIKEFDIIGKEIKKNKGEEFPEEKEDKKVNQSKSEKPNSDTKTAKKAESIEKSSKTENNSEAKTKVPEAKSKIVTKTVTENKKPDLADEVMASIAQMKRDREERLKKQEETGKAIQTKRGSEKAEKSKTSKSKVEKQDDKQSAKKTISTKSTTTKSKEKAIEGNKGLNKSAKTKDSSKAKTPSKTKNTTKSTNPAEKKQESKTTKSAKTVENKKESTITKSKKKPSEKKIIDSFIMSDIRIRPKQEPENTPKEDLSKKSTELPSNLISENLAKIFEKQGKTPKAIAIYKELILKYPDKKSYFAQKITELEK